jgi:hypothetical protein
MFANYRDASRFARETAVLHRRSVEIVRQGDQFSVPDLGDTRGQPNAQSPTAKNSSDSDFNDDLWEQVSQDRVRRQKEESARQLADVQLREEKLLADKRRHEENKKRLEERKPFLLKRERFYRGLEDVALDQEWACRDRNGLQSDETQLLRDLVRERKGISPVYGISLKVCRSCGEVGDSCTCGRSWF